jgi:hypothetical protein
MTTMTKFKHIFFASLLCSAMQAFSQVPNGEMEDWQNKTIGNVTVKSPVGWSTSNEYMLSNNKPANAFQELGSFTGTYAIKLMNTPNPDNVPAYMYTYSKRNNFEYTDKFKVNGKPSALQLKYMYDYVLQDTFDVNINLYKNGEYVGYGYNSVTGKNNNYKNLIVQIAYTDHDVMPDSASIYINAGSSAALKVGTYLIVDKIELLTTTTGIRENENDKASAVVFPNPSNSFVSIQVKDDEARDAYMVDITGKVVMHITNPDEQIYVGGLPKGIYFIQINTIKGKKATNKFILN